MTPYNKKIDIETSKQLTIKGRRWELVSIIVHSGKGQHAGHYVAYRKDKQKVWKMFDDGQVKTSSPFDNQFGCPNVFVFVPNTNEHYKHCQNQYLSMKYHFTFSFTSRV